MYHDQALIPLKLLHFDSAVNITLGLPFIRTSVDHGVAYDLAGRGSASSRSLEEAIRLAAEMALSKLKRGAGNSQGMQGEGAEGKKERTLWLKIRSWFAAPANTI